MPNTLTATIRAGRGKGPARQARIAGDVPAVIYGLGGENLSVLVNGRELDHILHGGVNSLITLALPGRDELAMCRQVQRHPVKRTIEHVDFMRVLADQAVEAEVALHLVGESEGVRNGGLLEQLLFSIRISARPADIPASIEFDITGLGLGDQLHAAGVALPPGVKLALDDGELLAQIAVPRGLATAGDEGSGEAAAGAAAE
jgi:large subunit ribosomal protein L25